MTVLAPRIYNLHPLLAGPIGRWPEHLPRIAAMGFDWLYVNAFFLPGASGSIYAVADPLELHPRVRGASEVPADRLIAGFAAEARRHGLKLMTDLVVPHAARDGRLPRERPEWFRWDHGALASPMLANPGDPHRPRMMADLAELDLDHPERRPWQIEHFAKLALHHAALGVEGFRCSAAYKVPAAFWTELNGQIRAERPSLVMLAAALGCSFEEVIRLAPCGFDLVFDSSRWWNFHDRWFLDQRRQLCEVGAPVAFPEDHNTPRLRVAYDAETAEEVARLYRGRYLLAALLGAGTLVPMGFEFGVRRRLDPVTSAPEDWQAETSPPLVDLQDYLAAVNRLKATNAALQRPGTLRRVSAPNSRVVALLRHTHATADDPALILVNPDRSRADGLPMGPLLTAAGGRVEGFSDITPLVEPQTFDASAGLTLQPWGVRLFRGRAAAADRAPPATAGAALLERLAPRRVAIERVAPELDGGRFAAKRLVGELLRVEADLFADGHDKIAAALLYRAADEHDWRRAPMAFVDNDRWAGLFAPTRNTRWFYTVEAWRDLFATWRAEIVKKHDAGQKIALELQEGRNLAARAAAAASGAERGALQRLASSLEACRDDDGRQLALMLSAEVQNLMAAAGPREGVTRYPRELEVVVDRTAGGFAAWYEIFPRSMSDDENRHGTFDDVIRKLPYVRDMGFDVLYFPPVHPIGRSHRKGRNNSLTAQPGDPGSPYAIGAAEGGHDALHPELGTLEDFRRMVAAAAEHGLEVALDFAIQCSPDHPWIAQHPDWFEWRPDGTIRYAENPPKKYEDIVNVQFYKDGEAIIDLWEALRDVVLFWVSQGVLTFRVDNPHTKPLPFWEFLIREVQDRHPGVVFLSEAFTRPKMMKRLAKLGFTQSYSYFTWRNSKAELAEYLTELTQDEPREHMRPNFFVNTPDINPKFLQTSGRPGFRIRAALAATLSPLWGVYCGFELCEGTPVPGKEDYLDSEKYALRAWDWDRPGHIRDDIRLLNGLRRDNPAMWGFTNLAFMSSSSDQVLVYAKITDALDNAVLIAINLDPHQPQGSRFEVPLWRFGLGDEASIAVEDLVGGQRFTWTGKNQHVWLDPAQNPYAIWRLVPPGLPA